MSLLGFKAQNHPQQTAVRGALDEVDDRGTKWEFIRDLERRLGGPFDLDVAAAPHNAKAPKFFTRADDGLSQAWMIDPTTANDINVWCNPPYSRVKGVMDLGSWVAKAWEEWGKPRRPHLVAMLVPANRSEQAWWQDYVEPYRDRPGSPLRVEFLRGRMRFDMPPGWVTPDKGDRPPFGLALLIWRDPTEHRGPRPYLPSENPCSPGKCCPAHHFEGCTDGGPGCCADCPINPTSAPEADR